MIENDKNKDQVTIGFRGSEEYRTALQREALDRGIKVQPMLEKLIREHLAVPQSSPALTPEESVHVAALLYALRNANDDKLFQIELLLKPFLNKPAAQSPARRKSA